MAHDAALNGAWASRATLRDFATRRPLARAAFERFLENGDMALLLLDLDNTVADRAAAFEHWMTCKLAVWSPTDPGARPFLVREDADGVSPRREFLATVAER